MSEHEQRGRLRSGSHFGSRTSKDFAASRSHRSPGKRGLPRSVSSGSDYEMGNARPYLPVRRGSTRKAQRGFGRKNSTRTTFSRVDAYGRYVSGHAAFRRKRQGMRRAIIAAAVVCVVGGLAALAYFGFFLHRPVTITVNEKRVTLPVNSTIDSVFAIAKPAVEPGNFVSVRGNVLTKGGGHKYAVRLNGTDLSPSQWMNTKVVGDETVEFSKGSDITEDFDVAVTDVQPKLTFDGSAGTIAYVAKWGMAGRQEVRTGKKSGEVSDPIMAQQVQDCVIRYTNINPAQNKRLVALTFDDGPSVYTQRYLDILKEHGVKATFFNLGTNVANFPDLTKACVDAGMQVCSHTYSHDSLTTLPPEKVHRELADTFSVLKEKANVVTTTLRPPYGAFKQKTWLDTKGAMSMSVLWDLDSEDWRRPGAERIVANSTVGISSGDIILMHDGGGNRDQDLQALPQIIQKLKNEGYTFVTLAELLASDSSIPEDIAKGNAAMPKDAIWPTTMG